MPRKSKGRTRKGEDKTPPKRMLILCEGQTEVVYFKGFVAEKNSRNRSRKKVNVEVYQPKQFKPEALLKEAIKELKKAKKDQLPFDSVWIVFDRDEHPRIPETFAKAQKENVNIAYSATCFEFLVLLHFRYTSRNYSNCQELEQELQRQYIPNYKKGAKSIFKALKAQSSTAKANAERLLQSLDDQAAYQQNPYTSVHLLLQALEDF